MSTLAFHSEENFEIVILKSFRIRDFIGHDSMFALDFVSTIILKKWRGSHSVTISRTFIFPDKILFKCITTLAEMTWKKDSNRVFSVTFLRFA